MAFRVPTFVRGLQRFLKSLSGENKPWMEGRLGESTHATWTSKWNLFSGNVTRTRSIEREYSGPRAADTLTYIATFLTGVVKYGQPVAHGVPTNLNIPFSGLFAH